MPFDAYGNWTQGNDPGMAYTQGGSYSSPQTGYTPVPPGTVIPVTPGDPTHGGMFGPGGYVGPQAVTNDPFAYTGGSLLTPYTQQFSYPGVYGASPTGSGTPVSGGDPNGDLRAQVIYLANQSGRPDIAANPDYWMEQIAGKGQGPGGANGPIDTGYWGNRFATANTGASSSFGGGYFGSQLSPMAPFQFGEFNYSPQQVGSVSAPTPMSAPTPFSYGAFTAPQAFTPSQFGYGQAVPTGPANETFHAPTLDETNDPGYAFRLQQAQQAIQNQASAQGARGGDVLKAMQDYAQNYASSEYGNVYNRAFGQFTEQQQRAMALYQQQLQAQNQGYSQAYGTSALNNQNNLASAALNAQNALAAYQTNYNVASGVNQQNFQNAFNVYNANAQNQLAAAGLTEQAQTTNAQLGWQAASGVFDRNYQNAWNAYNAQWQQQLAAAGLGYQYAGLGLQAQNQGFNQALTSYGTNRDTFQSNQNNQFNRLYSMGQLGAGAANTLVGAGGNYANAGSNLYTNQANANAGAQIASGNAWSGALAGAGNMVNTGVMYGSQLNPYYYGGLHTGTPPPPGGYPSPVSPGGYAPNPGFGGYNA